MPSTPPVAPWMNLLTISKKVKLRRQHSGVQAKMK
jgi:hypothetical protein